jgi:hypothetical protein
MRPLLLPLQMLLLMFAGWVNRHQLDVIEYLQDENRVLKERLGGRRLRFTDAERRRLARKAQALGRKVLNELESLVTPETLLRWFRELVASKWNYTHRRGPGRPQVTKTIVDLVLQMALENPSWGYTRIRGAANWSFLVRVAGEGRVNNHGKRLLGKKLRISLGNYPEVTLQAARARANHMADQAKRGVNPKELLKESATAGSLTVADLSK